MRNDGVDNTGKFRFFGKICWSQMGNLGKYFIVLFVSLLVQQVQGAPGWNEIAHKNGQVKELYHVDSPFQAQHLYQGIEGRFVELTRFPLEDKVKIFPVPLLISNEEHIRLIRGSEQRAKALKAFFVDVFTGMGKREIIKAKIMSEEQIRAVVISNQTTVENLRNWWVAKGVSDVSFLFGCDIIRDELGEFSVVEDNVGSIGGMGDVVPVRKVLLGTMGLKIEEKSALEILVNHFLSEHKVSANDSRVVAILDATDIKEDDSNKESMEDPDNEGKREKDILKAMGIRVVSQEDFKKTEIEKVKNGETQYLITTSPIESVGLKNIDLAHVLAQFKKGKIHLLFSPGVEVLSSKALTPFVDQFISFYLRETSILKSLETEWVTGLDSNVEAGWVYKKANGSQGGQVFLADETREKGRSALKEHLMDWNSWGATFNADPEIPFFVRQRRVYPSYIPAHLPDSWVRFNVDFRPLTLVSSESVKVAPQIWGRASMDVSGNLNNVSRGAFELVILSKGDCDSVLF